MSSFGMARWVSAVSVGGCTAIALLSLVHCGGSDTSSGGASGSAGVSGAGQAGSGTSSGGSAGHAGAVAQAGTGGFANISGSGNSAGSNSSAGSDCGNFKSGDQTCDDCIQQQPTCCSSAKACAAADDGGVDATGHSRCEQLLDCAYKCASTPGAGGAAPPSYTQCEVTCKQSYNESEYDLANGISACVSALCSQQCTNALQ